MERADERYRVDVRTRETYESRCCGGLSMPSSDAWTVVKKAWMMLKRLAGGIGCCMPSLMLDAFFEKMEKTLMIVLEVLLKRRRGSNIGKTSCLYRRPRGTVNTQRPIQVRSPAMMTSTDSRSYHSPWFLPISFRFSGGSELYTHWEANHISRGTHDWKAGAPCVHM